MKGQGSRAAGYVVGVVLLVPLVLLGLFVLPFVGSTGFAVATAVTGVAALVIWLGRVGTRDVG